MRLDVSQRRPPRSWTRCVELVDQRRHRQRRAIAPRLGEADGEILAHPVDGKAEIELALDHGRERGSPSARIAPRPWRWSRPRLGDRARRGCAKLSPSDERLHQPGDADLVDHLGELAAAGGAHQRHGAAVMRHHRLACAKTGASPPTMMVSLPLTAPAWPPETGASRKPSPSPSPAPPSRAPARPRRWCGRRRSRPCAMPANAPSLPAHHLRARRRHCRRR